MKSLILTYAISTIIYSVLSIFFWQHLYKNKEFEKINIKLHVFLLIGIIAHGFSLRANLLENNSLFLNPTIGFSAILWLSLIILWTENTIARKMGRLYLILLPLGALSCILAANFAKKSLIQSSENYWLRIHLFLALSSYGLITVAAFHAIFMALLNYYLRNFLKKISENSFVNQIFEIQPPILIQEKILFRTIGIGFLFLTLTVGSGLVASVIVLNETSWLFDHKIIFTLLSWVTFGLLLLGRYRWGWRGRVALHWTLSGFLFLVLTYVSQKFIISKIIS
ncbi:MAG: cytochrome c biogenesis protein CcsA [Bordetella sp.]|nr:MAG: cytochrome c biogenesis protein CcsA [Bordetella sp.]